MWSGPSGQSQLCQDPSLLSLFRCCRVVFCWMSLSKAYMCLKVNYKRLFEFGFMPFPGVSFLVVLGTVQTPKSRFASPRDSSCRYIARQAFQFLKRSIAPPLEIDPLLDEYGHNFLILNRDIDFRKILRRFPTFSSTVPCRHLVSRMNPSTRPSARQSPGLPLNSCEMKSISFDHWGSRSSSSTAPART